MMKSRLYVAIATWKFLAPLSCPGDLSAQEVWKNPINGSKIVNCTVSTADEASPTRTPSWATPSPPMASGDVVPAPPPLPSDTGGGTGRSNSDSPCIGRSFTYPGWTVVSGSGSESDSLIIRNRATGHATTCRVNPSTEDGGRFTNSNSSFVCIGHENFADHGLNAPPDTQLSWDTNSKSEKAVVVRQSWMCADKTVAGTSSYVVVFPRA